MTAQEAEPWKPLFWTDPEQFMENLFKDDEARVRAYTTVQDILFGEIMRYGGSFNRPEWIVPLRHLYDKFVNHGMTVEQRWEVLSYVATLVENSKAFTVNAFLPFICQDPHRHIVAKAAVDYVSLGPLLNDDPMFFPKELIGLIADGELRNPGAAFGALLVLGDPRLCKLLWPLEERSFVL